MLITQSQHGAITVALFNQSRLDASVSVRFKDNMRAIADDGVEHVILDMSEIEFMDSSGLGAVVSVMKYFGDDRCFELARPTPIVNKLFALTRMDKVFVIYQFLDEALEPRVQPLS